MPLATPSEARLTAATAARRTFIRPLIIRLTKTVVAAAEIHAALMPTFEVWLDWPLGLNPKPTLGKRRYGFPLCGLGQRQPLGFLPTIVRIL
jgi:hypothetical protein